MEKPASSTSVLVFLMVAYGFAIAAGALVMVSGGFRSALAFPALITMMFSPSVGSILATKFVNHQSLKVNGVAKGRLRYYLFGWAYPIAFILIGAVFVFLLGTATVSFNDLARILPTMPGIPNSALIALIVVNLLLAPFINFVPALGEEYGWRGFLQPALVERFGRFAGLTLTGLI
jgi:membrane protease YdiL (CAAX protease family)